MPPIYRYDRSRRSQSRIYDWLCMHAHINIFFHTMQAIILMAEYMPRIMQCMHACMHACIDLITACKFAGPRIFF